MLFFLNFQFPLMWADLNLTNRIKTKRDEFYVSLIYVSITKLMKFPKMLKRMKLKTRPNFCYSAKIQNKLHCSKSWVMFSISSFLTTGNFIMVLWNTHWIAPDQLNHMSSQILCLQKNDFLFLLGTNTLIIWKVPYYHLINCVTSFKHLHFGT